MFMEGEKDHKLGNFLSLSNWLKNRYAKTACFNFTQAMENSTDY